MYRCKTLLSAGSMLVLIGAAAPGAAEAEIVVEARVQSQTAARTGVRETAGQARRPDVLGRRVTLDLVDAPLGSALEAIARLADFALAYNSSILPAARTVTVSAADLPVRDALARVLEGTGLEPVMTRTGQLTLVRRPDPPARARGSAPAAAQQAVVTGVVTDEATGEVLRGAQVRVEESELSAVTTAEGRYTLEDVPPGTHTLAARIIGYREARQEVTVAAGATASVDFTLAVSALPLDEVVVTGTMVPTRMRAVPSPVSVITAEDIERRGMVRFEDVLRAIPGLGVASNGGQDYFSFIYVRGASTFVQGSSTIKTYIDGVEVANPVYSLNQIDPTTIQRIELIRGPQASTLHGSNAIAGVLQIFTKKGTIGSQYTRIQAKLQAGAIQSHYKEGITPIQNHTLSIDAGDDNVSFRAALSYDHTGEWVEDELIEDLGWKVRNSTVNNLGLTAGLQYSRGSINARASARISQKSNGTPLGKALTERARTGHWNYPYYTKPSGTETAFDLQTYSVHLDYTPLPQWQHQITIGQDGTTAEFRQPQPRRTTPADTFLLYQSLDWHRRSIQYRTALSVSIGQALNSTFQAGVDRSSFSQRIVATQDAKQLQGGLGNKSANLTRGTVLNHGLFLQAQLGWLDRLFVTGGLRLDSNTGFGDGYGAEWSPRAGLAHILDLGSIGVKSRVSFGKAIRPPEPHQKLGQALGNFVYQENTELGPEAQSGYDIGTEIHLGNHASLSLTYYDQTANDLIAPVRLSDPGDIPQVQQYQNVGRIRNTGWEFEAAANVGPIIARGHYSILESTVDQLSATYTGTDFVTGQEPPFVPESTGGASVTYANERATVTLGMTLKGTWKAVRYLDYFEALFGTDPNRTPYTGNVGDYIADYEPVRRYELNARYRLVPRLTGMIMINNLLNDGNPDRYDIDLVQGRHLVVGVQYDSNI